MSLSLPVTVTVETKWFPPITVDLTGKTPPSVAGQVTGVGLVVLTKLLKPRATVQLNGVQVARWEPAGDPNPNAWPKTRVALFIVTGLVAYKLLRLVL